jgi:hypothetical protein
MAQSANFTDKTTSKISARSAKFTDDAHSKQAEHFQGVEKFVIYPWSWF